MDLTGVLTITFVAAVLGWMLYNKLAAGRAVGKSAEKLREEIPELGSADRALVYCYSKLDITRNMELAQAMGIRATPTTLILDGGEIRKVLVGVKPPELLKQALETA